MQYVKKLGFTFIDADKPNSVNYFDLAAQMSRPGAVIVIDNVMGNPPAMVCDEGVEESFALAGRTLIESVGQDERVEATVMQFVGAKGWDGFLFAVVL